jgi:transketolase
MAKAIREIYGETLAQLGNTIENLVVLDADVAGSTKSGLFKDAHPERFFDMGIAEANMAATAAGLATTGYVPFINTFAVFITSASLLSLRGQICYGNLNVKLGGAYAGMSDARDGATHHALEDIAVLRALPNMKILSVCDAAETRWATEYAAKCDGPCYIRLSRDTMPDLYSEGHSFTFGKAETVRAGKDATIIATGLMVHNALEAAKLLASENISVTVLDMHTIKPLDADAVLLAAEQCPIITAEEHNVIGGLGSAVAEVMAKHGCAQRLIRVGLQDTFSETGDYPSLQKKYGIDAESIAAAVKRSLNK